MTSIAPITDTTEFPCPGWCTEPADHPFSVPENPLDPPDRTHRRSFGDFVRVEQWENQGAPMDPPSVDLYDEQGSDAFWAMTSDRADEIADQLRAATRFLRMLAGPEPVGPCGTTICWEGWPTLPGGQYIRCVRPAGHFGNHQRGDG